MELYFNIAHVIFGLLSNNWLSLVIASIFLCYNLFSRLQKKNSFNMIIDDIKENLKSSDKVGIEYKIKFIFYVLISIYALCYAILANFDDEDAFESLKIFG